MVANGATLDVENTKGALDVNCEKYSSTVLQLLLNTCWGLYEANPCTVNSSKCSR